MRCLVITLALLLSFSCNRDNNQRPDDCLSPFIIIRYDLNIPSDLAKFQLWERENIEKYNEEKTNSYTKQYLSLAIDNYATIGFQDSQFSIYTICNGEWGGRVYFVDRSDTNKIYFLPSTCPVQIQKIEDAYYITEALGHMIGHSSLVKISNPKKLVVLSPELLKTDWKAKIFQNLTNQKIVDSLNQQRAELIDTFHVAFNLYFKYDLKDYIIYTDFENTYLGLLKNKKIIKIDSLSHFNTYSAEPKQFVNNIHRYYYENSRGYYQGETTSNKGAIYVKEDTIIIANKHWVDEATY